MGAPPLRPAKAARASRLRALVEAHLGSHDVARTIYGAIIGLALLLALEAHPPTAAATAGLLLGTAMTVGLAELYGEIVGTEARLRRGIRRSDIVPMLRESIAVMAGAGFPALFFLIAAAGTIERSTAFTLAKWTGLGLICSYGYLAARLSGSGPLRACVHAAAVGALAGVLIALKALLH